MSKNSKSRTKKKPKIIKLSPERLAEIIQAIKDSNLSEELTDAVIDMVSGNGWLIDALERGELTIAKLRKIVFGEQTELAVNRRKNKANGRGIGSDNDRPDDATADNKQTNDDNKNQKKPGHGRMTIEAYSGANIIDVEFEELGPGSDCPDDYCDGRLYQLQPGALLRITGNPIITANRYNLQKLRCALCGTVYTASLPEGVSDKKYDEACIAMLMINKYFMSMPLFRQENLQRYLGVPLSDSTQWELIASYSDMLETLYDAFLYDAAQAKGISFDDTKATVLEQLATNKAAAHKGEKKACYTTGFVSAHDNHLSYIFMTGNKPAGQNIGPILKLRDPKLDAPYLMCDGLTANIPEGISKDLYTLCYCLVHARRQFYELPEGYDDLADEVIRRIGKIYDHENHAKKMPTEERLAYHEKHSTPIMDELNTYLNQQASEFEPNSVAGRAIAYMLKRWTGLTQFLRHADAPIDNNITERALKLIIQVRKSSMFYKTLKSAKIASHIQTALYSAAQNDINPYEYMQALLCYAEAVKQQPRRWLPWFYKDTLSSMRR